jgi:hypothetical protein
MILDVKGLIDGAEYTFAVFAVDDSSLASEPGTYTTVVGTLTPVLKLSVPAKVRAGSSVYANASVNAPWSTICEFWARNIKRSWYRLGTSAVTGYEVRECGMTIRVNEGMEIQVRTQAEEGQYAGASAARSVLTTGSVSIKRSASAVSRGRAFTISGVASPAMNRQPVTVQRLSGRTWVKVATVYTNSSGAYALRTSTKTRGKIYYRAVSGANYYRVSAVSGSTYVTVR